jgi:Fe2+ transport system protein FeoA
MIADLDVSRERLGELGVKAGHQVKIIKKIK